MQRLPAIILAGSDLDPVELPEVGRGQTSLSGYKGADLQIGGRPLIQCVVDRLRSSGLFAPIYVVGPLGVYGNVDTTGDLIDSGARFSDNVRAALKSVCPRHPGIPITFLTCDVLPSPDDLESAMSRYHRDGRCAVFFPLIRAPEDPESLGASFWKPSYRIVAREGDPAINILPGHLVVVEPVGLRVHLLLRLLELGYRTRNQPIHRRRPVMIRGVLWELLRGDARRLLQLRLPSLTWAVLRAAVTASRRLQAGALTRSKLEDALSVIFVSTRHRDRYPAPAVRIPIIDGLSLALDIDTEEEARALGAMREANPDPARPR